jgi:DNA alkylation damage repair protein AlkB
VVVVCEVKKLRPNSSRHEPSQLRAVTSSSNPLLPTVVGSPSVVFLYPPSARHFEMQSCAAESSSSSGMMMQQQSMTMQQTDGGMQAMDTMSHSPNRSSSSSSSSSDTSAYRLIERIYKLRTTVPSASSAAAQSGKEKRRRKREREKRKKEGEGEESDDEEDEWERWKPHTIDVLHLDRNTPENRARIIEHPLCAVPATASESSWLSPSCRIFSFPSLPGFHFLSGALSKEMQAWWSWRCLAAYSGTGHTNLTNLERLRREEEDNGKGEAGAVSSHPASSSPSPSPWSQSLSSPSFSPLSSLRWASLGFHYDWTRREYTASARSAFPPELEGLAVEIAQRAGVAFEKPEAAIVNYYPSTGMMGAHVDDAELTKLQPIVSISLGCSAIFLLGGRTKSTPPTGFLLRSGDAVIMSEESRVCFHGIPRIIEGSWPERRRKRRKKEKESEESKENVESSADSASSSFFPEAWTPEQSLADLPCTVLPDGTREITWPSCLTSSNLPLPSPSSLLPTFRFLRSSRLNLNVRQVEDGEFRYEKGMTSGKAREMELEEQRRRSRGEVKKPDAASAAEAMDTSSSAPTSSSSKAP